MTVSLTIIKYPWWAVPFAFLSMTLFRVPLWLNKSIHFWRLMGSGQNNGFDWRPNLKQWAVLVVSEPGPENGPAREAAQNAETPLHKPATNFIITWATLFNCKTITFLLDPIEGHGRWNGKQVFGMLPKQSAYEGKIAVLTRATIRPSRLFHFWKHVPGVVSHLPGAKGLLQSYGIGEIPFIKQATFSIWETKEDMLAFSYNLKDHRQVIQKTRGENWYSEEMFVRFRVLGVSET